jgi:hypothetical protein
MPIRPEDFPRWLADRATRRIDAHTHRVAVVQMIDWLIGRHASAAMRARAMGSAADRPADAHAASRREAELAYA